MTVLTILKLVFTTVRKAHTSAVERSLKLTLLIDNSHESDNCCYAQKDMACLKL